MESIYIIEQVNSRGDEWTYKTRILKDDYLKAYTSLMEQVAILREDGVDEDELVSEAIDMVIDKEDLPNEGPFINLFSNSMYEKNWLETLETNHKALMEGKGIRVEQEESILGAGSSKLQALIALMAFDENEEW